MFAFTYLQVMPEFLDFLFSFGKQSHAEDLNCSGFRQQTRLADPEQGLKVPELGWSGQDLQVCYSLKSVERSHSQEGWPWSIRHCAVHHCFDVKNVRSTWIIIKGDQLMEKRIQSATSERGPPELSSFQTIERAFAAALGTHLTLCDWSAENWRWYIKFLEDRFQEMTRGTISTNADFPRSPGVETPSFGRLSRSQTLETQGTRKSSFSKFSRTRTPTTERFQLRTKSSQNLVVQTYTNVDTGLKQPLPPGPIPPGFQANAPSTFKFQVNQLETDGQQQFKFSDIQRTHDIEEKGKEAALVLELNLNVISQLRQYYQSVIRYPKFPELISQQCREDIIRFERRIDSIENDTRLQILRVEGLLRLLTDRKMLVSRRFPCIMTWPTSITK